MKMFKAIGNFFHAVHLRIVEFFAAFLLRAAGKMVRRTIILRGKNPDYVPPPPPAPKKEPTPLLDPVEVMEKVAKFRTLQYSTLYGGGGGGENWVKKMSEHPVLKARAQYEAKQKVKPSQEMEEHEAALVSEAACLQDVPRTFVTGTLPVREPEPKSKKSKKEDK